MSKRIEEMFAFVTIDPDGDEGVMAMESAFGMMPLVAADRERVESLRPHVQNIANQMGVKIQLIRFGGKREDLEVIVPKV